MKEKIIKAFKITLLNTPITDINTFDEDILTSRRIGNFTLKRVLGHYIIFYCNYSIALNKDEYTSLSNIIIEHIEAGYNKELDKIIKNDEQNTTNNKP